ncbi:MAG: glycosyltransferase family 2 protein [Anaerolineae bacterium]
MSVLSVVIPAYNEQDGISSIIERVLAIKSSLFEAGIEDLELIVVDDGSHDRTAEIASSYQEVRLIRHLVNQGYGAALKTGFRHARGDLLAFLDADGTYPPEEFPRLCQAALEQKADLVIGSRMAGMESQMPLMRRLGNIIFAALVSFVSNHSVSDSASGMRVLRREILTRFYPLPDGLNFTPVMSTRALHENVKMVEVPIPYRERVGRSKLSILGDGTRFFSSIVWTALNYNPVRILGGMGLTGLAVASGIGGVLVAMRLRGINYLGPWGVLGVFTALVLGVSGVSIFTLGAAFNYLVSLFHKRPVRQGLLGRPLFKKPLERHFGWLGLLTTAGGLVLGAVSMALGLNGWPITRLWFYLMVSAMAVLIGLQLMVSWVMMCTLSELSEREIKIEKDVNGTKAED